MTRKAALRSVATKSQVSREGGVEYRISWLVAGLMLALSGIFEAIQFLFNLTVFLALASLYVTFLSYAIFIIWFLLLGENYLGGRKAVAKMLALAGGLIAEFIPIVNALPITTVTLLIIILLSRKEDREEAAKSAKVPAKTVSIRMGTAGAPPAAANNNESRTQAA